MWQRLASLAALISVGLGYPSFYITYQGCVQPYVGQTLMGRPLQLVTDGSLSVSPGARIQAGTSVALTITAAVDGQYLLFISGGTASVVAPWSNAGTCSTLSWTTTSSSRATATVTPANSGTMVVIVLYAPAYGPVLMSNFSVDLGGTTSGCTDMTQSSGAAWYDSGGSSYTCAAYYSQAASRCTSDGGQYSNFGMNADAACCACGGGSRGRSCSDLLNRDGSAWYDSGGSNYNCAYYAGAGKCTAEGGSYSNNGMTANQACCVCGGGSAGTGGTLVPTISPTLAPTVTSRCTDLTFSNGQSWYDSGGSNYNCAYYQTSSKCVSEGSSYSNGGYNAQQACCACGGGSSGRGGTLSPTMAPTVTSACTDIPFPSGSSWYDSGGSAYTCAQHYTTQAICTSEGSQYSNQGMSANVACCTCGGGTRGTQCWIAQSGTTVVNLCTTGSCVAASGVTLTSTPVLGTCSSRGGGTDYTGTACWVGSNVPATASCQSGYTCIPLYPGYNTQQIMPGTCQAAVVGTQPSGGVCVTGGQYANIAIYQCVPGLTCVTTATYGGYTQNPFQQTQTVAVGTCLTPTPAGSLGSDCSTTGVCNTGLTCYVQGIGAGVGIGGGYTRSCQFTGTGQTCTTNADCGSNLACLATGTYNPPATCQPTTSITTGGCKDTVMPGSVSTPWHDVRGTTYTCVNQYTKAGQCLTVGSTYAFQGLTANLACCVCGGGVKS